MVIELPRKNLNSAARALLAPRIPYIPVNRGTERGYLNNDLENRFCVKGAFNGALSRGVCRVQVNPVLKSLLSTLLVHNVLLTNYEEGIKGILAGRVKHNDLFFFLLFFCD